MSTISLTVTPGITLTGVAPYDHTDLNLLGTPTVSISTQAQQDLTDAVAENLGPGAASPNFFKNADFSQWTRGTSPVTCGVNAKTYRADYWWLRPLYDAGTPTTSPTVSYEQEDDFIHDAYLYAIKLTPGGQADQGDIELGQDIPARLCAELGAQTNFVVAFEVENQTNFVGGGTFAPQCRVYTCNSPDNFTSTTLRETVNAKDIDGNAKTLARHEYAVVYFTFSPASYKADLANGAEICLVFPDGVQTGYVRVFAQPKLEANATPTQRVQERVVESEDTDVATSYAVGRFFNGTLAEWIVASGSATTVDSYAPRGWYARTGTGTITLARDTTTVPNTTVDNSAKLTGDATASGLCYFGQKIFARDAAVARVSLSFQAYVYNNTGADLIPTLVINTCNATDNFSATTPQIEQALTTIPAASWGLVTHVFDASSVTDFAKGCRVELRFPAGSLDSNAKFIHVAALDLRAGVETPAFKGEPSARTSPLTGTRGLLLESHTTAYTNLIYFTVDEAVLVAPDESARRYSAPTTGIQIDPTTSGASGLDTGSFASGTEYHVWLIGSSSGLSAMISASATVPTMPGGYLWKARVSSFKTGGSATLPSFFQRNGRVNIQRQVVTFAPTVSGTWETVSLSSTIVPSTARSIGGNVGATTNTSTRISLCGYRNTSGNLASGAQTIEIPALGAALSVATGDPAYYAAAPFSIDIYTAATCYATSSTVGSPTFSIMITSYDVDH